MKKKIVLTAEAILLLLAAGIFDLIFYRFGRMGQGPNHDFYPIIPFGTEIIVYILLAFAILWLAWMVLYRNSKSRFVAILFLIIGAVTLFSTSLSGYWFWNGLIISRTRVWYTDIISSHYSFTSMVSAMVLVIGFIRLLPERILWLPRDS